MLNIGFSLLHVFSDIRNFFASRKILWQDKAIATIVALSFSLSIMLKERGSLLGLLLVPLLLFYPYGSGDKKSIVKQFTSPLYLVFYAWLAVFACSLFWGMWHNNMMSPADYRHDIFIHGWFVIGRFCLLVILLAPLWWFFNRQPLTRHITIDLIALISFCVMLTMVILIEAGYLTRIWFRNDQYSENVALLFLLLLPGLIRKNVVAWLCLPLIGLLHVPLMEWRGHLFGYGTARLWTMAIFMGLFIYVLSPLWQGLTKKWRLLFWLAIVGGYAALIIILLGSGLIYKTNDPFNHPFLSFLSSLGFDVDSLKERFKFWHFIFYYIIDQPFLGHGININRYLPTLTADYHTVIFSFLPYDAVKGECFLINGCEALNQPHFVWIELLLDAGIFSPLLLFILFAMVLWYLMIQKNNQPFTRGAFCFFVSFAFCFILTNSIYAFWQFYMAAMAMLLLLTQSASNTNKSTKLKNNKKTRTS